MAKFKVGDLVKIKEGVHEDGMPKSRMGLVISEWGEHRGGPDRNPRHKYTSIYNVQMLNGHQMKMHEMFLEIVQEGTNEKEVK
jgi:hypothetical protein